MFIRTKKVKGPKGNIYEYEQLVETYKVNGKTKQKVIMTLGKKGEVNPERVESMIQALLKKNPTVELVRQMDQKDPEIKIHSNRDLGAYIIFRHLWKQLKLQTAIEVIAPRGKAKVFAEMIFLLVLYRIIDPGSERRMTNIFAPHVYHQLEKIPVLNEWYRAITRLQKNREGIEEHVYQQLEGMFPGRMSLMYFDTTSLVLFGDYEKSAMVKYGKSKDKRSDKKQVVVGLVLNELGLPVGVTEEKGNAIDVQNFVSMLEKMKEKYQTNRMIFVGDKGMNSKKNRDLLKEDGQEYILGVRAGREKAVSEEILKQNFLWEKAEKLPYSKNQQKLVRQLQKRTALEGKEFHTRVVERCIGGRRMIFFFNPLEQKSAETKREAIIKALEKKVKTIKDLKQLIGNRGYRSLLTFGAVEEKEEKPIVVRIDQKKVERMKAFDGITVIETNTDLSALGGVEQYKRLITVEQSFSDLKSTLDCRPIYHKRDTNIQGHIFINFLGLLLYYFLFHQLSGNFEEEARYQIIQSLKDIQAHEVEQSGHRYLIRTELTPVFSQICSILKLKPPNRVLGYL